MYGIHTTMTLLCRIFHAVEPINDEMHVTNNWNTWPFILEYFKGNDFPVDDVISTHSQSQCSIVNGNMPKPIIHLLLWKCSYRWMKQPLFYCFENNSKQNRSKKISTMWFVYDDFLCRWIDDLMLFTFCDLISIHTCLDYYCNKK